MKTSKSQGSNCFGKNVIRILELEVGEKREMVYRGWADTPSLVDVV